MPEMPKNLAARLRTEGGKTAQFFRDLPEDDRSTCIYSDGGKWNVRQILAHLVSAEAGMTELIRSIVSGGAGAPEDFDLNAYNERRVRKMEADAWEDLLVEFDRRREESVGLVAGLSATDLERTGRHPWLGTTTVEEIIKIIYRHNQIHQREIRKALAAE